MISSFKIIRAIQLERRKVRQNAGDYFTGYRQALRTIEGHIQAFTLPKQKEALLYRESLRHFDKYRLYRSIKSAHRIATTYGGHRVAKFLKEVIEKEKTIALAKKEKDNNGGTIK